MKITDEHLAMAEAMSKDMGRLKYSITKGEGNKAGFLGELLFVEYFNAIHKNTYHYDAILNGLRIDVKTKNTNFPPLPHYYCSVADYNTEQKCEAYYFARVNEQKRIGYLLGGVSKKTFYSEAKYYEKDQIDPTSGSRQFRFTADCYNLEIFKLKQSNPSLILV